MQALFYCVMLFIREFWILVEAFLLLSYYGIMSTPFLMNVELLFNYHKKIAIDEKKRMIKYIIKYGCQEKLYVKTKDHMSGVGFKSKEGNY